MVLTSRSLPIAASLGEPQQLSLVLPLLAPSHDVRAEAETKEALPGSTVIIIDLA